MGLAAGVPLGFEDTYALAMCEADAERARQEAEAARQTAARVAQMLDYSRALAAGDLVRELDVYGDDNVGQMADALRELAASLRASIAEIGETATSVASASEELTSVSQDMGQGAEGASDLAGNVSAAAEQVSANGYWKRGIVNFDHHAPVDPSDPD